MTETPGTDLPRGDRSDTATSRTKDGSHTSAASRTDALRPGVPRTDVPRTDLPPAVSPPAEVSGADRPGGGARVYDARQTAPDREILQTAVNAWIFGYPLVLVDVTRRVMTGHGDPARARLNTFHHTRSFPDHTFTDVVSPNADTLYSTAWLDLRAEPMVLSIPGIGTRYHTLPVLSAWTEVFAAPGSRTTGRSGVDLALCPPGWNEDLPDGLIRVEAPTAMAWLLGRTAAAGTRDYLAVHRLQDEYRLTPLSAYEGRPPPNPVEPWPETADTTAPVDQVARLDGRAFFDRLAELLVENPPAPEDEPMMEALASLGVGPEGVRPDLAPDVAAAIAAVPAAGQAELRRIAEGLDVGRFNGWTIPRGLGRYGTNYAKRAYVAFIGLGANLDADAVYPHTTVDSAGRPLSGAHEYRIRFEAGQLPPVRGFWSLTLYNDKRFFVDNPIDRYAIGSRDRLSLNPDGSLDLWLSHDDPGDERRANWLPAPTGAFNVCLRLYWPGPPVLDGRWVPPPITRMD